MRLQTPTMLSLPLALRRGKRLRFESFYELVRAWNPACSAEADCSVASPTTEAAAAPMRPSTSRRL